VITYVIPGNDDAIRAGTLMCRVIADAVEEGRFIASRRAARSGVPAAVEGPPVLSPEEEAHRAEQQQEARNQAAAAQAEREARLATARAQAQAEPAEETADPAAETSDAESTVAESVTEPTTTQE
jgi:small subunit ribosomal protein S2